MTKVAAGITISLDGYIIGPNRGPGRGLGDSSVGAVVDGRHTARQPRAGAAPTRSVCRSSWWSTDRGRSRRRPIQVQARERAGAAIRDTQQAQGRP